MQVLHWRPFHNVLHYISGLISHYKAKRYHLICFYLHTLTNKYGRLYFGRATTFRRKVCGLIKGICGTQIHAKATVVDYQRAEGKFIIQPFIWIYPIFFIHLHVAAFYYFFSIALPGKQNVVNCRDKGYCLESNVRLLIIRTNINSDMVEVYFTRAAFDLFFLSNRNVGKNKVDAIIEGIFDIPFSFIYNFTAFSNN